MFSDLHAAITETKTFKNTMQNKKHSLPFLILARKQQIWSTSPGDSLRKCFAHQAERSGWSGTLCYQAWFWLIPAKSLNLFLTPRSTKWTPWSSPYFKEIVRKKEGSHSFSTQGQTNYLTGKGQLAMSGSLQGSSLPNVLQAFCMVLSSAGSGT